MEPGDKLHVTRNRSEGCRKLRVWRAADRRAHDVYTITGTFPRSEQHGLVSQLRRAAVSVATHVVAGQARKGRRELRQFTGIALGSLAEVEYLLEFSREEGDVSAEQYRMIESIRKDVGALLWRFGQAL